MRLIRDEQAYGRLLADFVEHRVDAAAFMTRFRHFWACDGADCVDGVRAMRDAPRNPPGLYALLDAINGLCDTFARNLPAGCGYRVSEEQFRKEIQSLAAALPPARPEQH